MLDLALFDLLEELALEDLFGAQRIAAMDERDLGGDVREIKRLFDRRIAPADDGDLLVAIEKAVAGGAGGDAAPTKLLFRRQAEIHGAGAGGDDERVAGIDRRVAGEPEGALAEIDRVDMIEQDLGLEALGMAAHPLHQLRSLDAIRIAGPVIDIGRGHQLPALFQSGDQDRLEIGAGRINRCGIAGGSGAEDQQPAVFGFEHAVHSKARGRSCG